MSYSKNHNTFCHLDAKPYTADVGNLCLRVEGDKTIQGMCREGLPMAAQFVLKFENGRCLFPENRQTSIGTNLVASQNVCRSHLARFIVNEIGNIKHVMSGLCVHPEDDGEDFPLAIGGSCIQKWAFSMTFNGSLKAKDSCECIQSSSGSTRPSDTEYFVLRADTCNEPGSHFTIFTGISCLYSHIYFLRNHFHSQNIEKILNCLNF